MSYHQEYLIFACTTHQQLTSTVHNKWRTICPSTTTNPRSTSATHPSCTNFKPAKSHLNLGSRWRRFTPRASAEIMIGRHKDNEGGRGEKKKGREWRRRCTRWRYFSTNLFYKKYFCLLSSTSTWVRNKKINWLTPPKTSKLLLPLHKQMKLNESNRKTIIWNKVCIKWNKNCNSVEMSCDNSRSPGKTTNSTSVSLTKICNRSKFSIGSYWPNQISRARKTKRWKNSWKFQRYN